MKNIYFTCGPSKLYPSYKKHVDWAMAHDAGSISHRSKLYESCHAHTVTSLKKLLKIPAPYHVFFLGSSLESMERVIQNCVDDTSVHFVNGSFSKKWYEMAVSLHKSPKKIEAPLGQAFDMVHAKIPKRTELICITQNETSSGVAIPVREIYALGTTHPNALLAVDLVSSAPHPMLDISRIDIAFFSVQKGFGMPAGLSVLIVSPRAIDKAMKLQSTGATIGSYHSFPELVKMGDKHQTPETPNVMAIIILGKICDDMLKKGLRRIRRETNQKAALVYAFFTRHPKYRPFVSDPTYRSPTTIVIDVAGESAGVRAKLAKKGYIVSSGYGKLKDAHIRIANFPAHESADIERLLKNI